VSEECNTNQTDYVKVLPNVRSEGLTVVSRIVFWDIVYFCTGIKLEEDTDAPILKVEMR